MKVVRTPQSRCRAAVARCDITPPIGIYHRMWGAALHERATGVHRPLEATLLWLEPAVPAVGEQLLILALDHCIIDAQEMRDIRQSVQSATQVGYENILVTMSHTHGAGLMSRTRSELPGGELLGAYLDQLAKQAADLAREAQGRVASATMSAPVGQNSLSACTVSSAATLIAWSAPQTRATSIRLLCRSLMVTSAPCIRKCCAANCPIIP